jgi:hypothetical protein
MNEDIQAELDKLRRSELSENTAEIATISALGAPRSAFRSSYGEAVHHVAFLARMQNTELRLRPRTSRFMS